jgi:D-proline reductase (dithiol) PrdB
MCHQSVGLIQGALESAGIATVSISLSREITSKMSLPRVLHAPFPFGYPLGRPGDAALQRSVIVQALALLRREGPPPVEADLVLPA